MSSPRVRARLGPDASRATDAELRHELAAGQLGALGELYDRYQAPLHGFIARVTRDAHDTDDLVQATFLAAAKSAERYDGRTSCRPWLIGIAATLIRRRRQTFARLVAVLSAFGNAQQRVNDPRPALQARSDVERALAKLSEPKRLTLLMAEVEGLGCAEIAEALGVPIGTVWTRLHAARRELRRTLAVDSEGEGPA
jgi:RNA polymerase sigma-70 factor (ECF subfamily)